MVQGPDEPSAEDPPRPVSGDKVDAVLRELGADETWAQEIDGDRKATEAVDPWERRD